MDGDGFCDNDRQRTVGRPTDGIGGAVIKDGMVLNIAFSVPLIMALLPLFARSWTGFWVAVAVTGLPPLLLWAAMATNGLDISRAFFALFAAVLSVSAVYGLGTALFRIVGQAQGWWLARSPYQEIVTVVVAAVIWAALALPMLVLVHDAEIKRTEAEQTDLSVMPGCAGLPSVASVEDQ